ncbi:MAG: ABC transporter permease [Rickettsiales bacterium]|nr:ABC transporter permease [Rickettsiales bacterium]
MKQHWVLFKQLLKRDLASRYQGSVLGRFWSVLHPLLLLGVYTFVFGIVFQAKWPELGHDGQTINFAIILYSGLIFHSFLAEILNRSAPLMLQHRNYITKVVFPLWILPVVVVTGALWMWLIQTGVLLAAMLLLGYSLSWHAALLPLIMLPLTLLGLGLGWLLASIGVFLRDLSQFMGLIVMVLLFLSPIFYSIDQLPAEYRTYIMLNPLTHIIENARLVLIKQSLPQFEVLATYTVAAALWARIGYWWFKRTRHTFNDIL